MAEEEIPSFLPKHAEGTYDCISGTFTPSTPDLSDIPAFFKNNVCAGA
jgi:hypothetical protein